MSPLYILDTDHLSLLQRGHPLVLARLASVPVAQRAVRIVTVDEQLQGRRRSSGVRKPRLTPPVSTSGCARLFSSSPPFRS